MSRRLRMRRPLGPWWALGASLVGALALAASFQPLDWWPLVVVGVGLQLAALRGRTSWQALGIGLATGLTFFLVHIEWITVYLGPIPHIALSAFMALWWGGGAVLLALAWRLGDGLGASWGRLLVVPALLAGLWTLRESLSSSWPWGGFSWCRLAYTQASSPVGDAVSWVGASGLTFLLAFVSALGLALVLVRGVMVRRRLTIGAAVALALVAIPVFPVETTGEVTVGAVQGDSEAGLLAPYVEGEIIQEHATATEPLFGEDLDMLVWPENAGEFNPQDDPADVALLDRIQEEVGAPIVLGAVTGYDDEVYNSVLVWDEGVRAEYHKRHPVPFAEYVPSREFFAPILDALGFLELIPRNYAIDDSPNAVDVAGVSAGLAICFDIIDDALVREMVLEHGAEIILAPTNNADFGEGSAENVQQLAIARLRAMEAGRALVNISTVGTSAMVLPDGSMVQSLPQYEPGAMIESLPTSSTVTPAIAAGAWIELAIALGALGGLLGLALHAGLERKAARA